MSFNVNPMKKSIIVIALLFFSGFAYSQTTVTLQDQCNCEVLSGTAVSSSGAVTPSGADAGDIYVNTSTGTIYFWDGDSWELTSSDDQQLTGFTFDGATNQLTLTLENGGNVNVDLSSLSDTLTDTNTTIASFGIDATNTNLVITDSDTNTYSVALADIAALVDTDTQYTAGNGLNLDGSNEFTAVASPDANNALDVRANGIYATDDQDAGEVSFDDSTSSLGETDVQGAIDALAGRTDNDTQYTAGNGLNLDGSNEFTAVASPDANNALDVRANGIYATDDQDAGEVSFDDSTSSLGETDVQGAIDALAGRTDNDTQYTAGGGLDLTGTVFSADVSTTAGNALTIDANGLYVPDTDNDTQYTAGNGLNLDGSNEFTAVASPDANNALDVRANGIYATDDQDAGEVSFDDSTSSLGETDVQGAIDALAGRTDNDTQYTAGNGLNLDGSNEFTAVASPDANNALDVRANGIYATDDQDAGEVSFDDSTSSLGETDVQGAIDALAGRTDNDTQYTAGGGLDLTGTVFSADVSTTAGNALTIDANGLYVPDTDNDTQYTAGNGLNLDGSNEFTAVASPDANNALDVRANGIYATDDQDAGEVSFDDSTSSLGETDVQGAIDALAGRTDNDTQYTAGNGLNLDGSNEFTAVASPDANNALDVRANGIYATDDQDAGEVSFDDSTSSLGETDVQGAIDALAGRTDNDTQYTAGGGLDLTGTVFSADVSTTAGNALTIDANGLYVPDTDNDTQYTAGNGLNLDGSNEFTAVASPDANNALDVRANGIYATDDQDAGEVTVADTGNNFTTDTVEAALAQLAALTDDDVSITNTVAGNRIATISETGITDVDINETVTSLSQNTTTGVISYSNEDSGTPDVTANVVSATNTANELIVGTDGGASFEMTDIDVDGDGAAETTVDQAMADITKITATAGRIFYPPSIAVDASTTGIKNIDLYQEYLDQFGTPTVSSAGAPAALPTYGRTDLYYYVTYADPSVFETDSGDPNFMTIDANGNLTIEVENLPTDYNALINVVFMVK